jgi:phosphoglycolate phosphatase
MIKYVGFDKDGTLIDSNNANIKAWSEIIKEEFRIDPKEAAEVFSVILPGQATKLQLALVLKRNNINYPEDKIFEKANEIAIRMGQMVKGTLLPESVEVLRKLKEQGYRIYISSNHQEKVVGEDLERTGIIKYIDYYVGARPDHPEFIKGIAHFKNVAEHFGLPFEAFIQETVFVGDSETDVKAAISCNIISIARIDIEPKERLEKAGAKFVIPNLSSLPEILKSL